MKFVIGLALILSGLWFYAGYHYLDVAVGFENLAYFLPHELGQLAVTFFTPLFLLWFLVGQMAQTRELRRLRHKMRRPRAKEKSGKAPDDSADSSSGGEPESDHEVHVESPRTSQSFPLLGEKDRRARAVKKAARERSHRQDAEKQTAQAKAARDTAESEVSAAMSAKAKSDIAAAEAQRARDDALRIAGEEKASRAELEKKLKEAMAARLAAENALSDAKARLPDSGAPEPSLSMTSPLNDADESIDQDKSDELMGLSPPKPPRRDPDRRTPTLATPGQGDAEVPDRAKQPTDVSSLERADEEMPKAGDPAAAYDDNEEADDDVGLPGRRPPQRTPFLSPVSTEEDGKKS